MLLSLRDLSMTVSEGNFRGRTTPLRTIPTPHLLAFADYFSLSATLESGKKSADIIATKFHLLKHAKNVKNRSFLRAPKIAETRMNTA